MTTYYNRQTTTDDTAIYGISDAHVNEVHSQVRYRYTGVYIERIIIVLYRNATVYGQRMIRNECKYLFEALTTGLSALRLAISSLLSRPPGPVIHPFGTLAVFRPVKRRDLWSSCISPPLWLSFPLLNPYETRLTDCLIMT